MTLLIKEYAQALDSLSYACLHGTRQQQIEAATYAREILAAGGHLLRTCAHRSSLGFPGLKPEYSEFAEVVGVGRPIKRSHMLKFKVTVRTAYGQHCWTAITHSSIDAALSALEKFEGQQVAVRVEAGGRQ